MWWRLFAAVSLLTLFVTLWENLVLLPSASEPEAVSSSTQPFVLQFAVEDEVRAKARTAASAHTLTHESSLRTPVQEARAPETSPPQTSPPQQFPQPSEEEECTPRPAPWLFDSTGRLKTGFHPELGVHLVELVWVDDETFYLFSYQPKWVTYNHTEGGMETTKMVSVTKTGVAAATSRLTSVTALLQLDPLRSPPNCNGQAATCEPVRMTRGFHYAIDVLACRYPTASSRASANTALASDLWAASARPLPRDLPRPARPTSAPAPALAHWEGRQEHAPHPHPYRTSVVNAVYAYNRHARELVDQSLKVGLTHVYFGVCAAADSEIFQAYERDFRDLVTRGALTLYSVGSFVRTFGQVNPSYGINFLCKHAANNVALYQAKRFEDAFLYVADLDDMLVPWGGRGVEEALAAVVAQQHLDLGQLCHLQLHSDEVREAKPARELELWKRFPERCDCSPIELPELRGDYTLTCGMAYKKVIHYVPNTDFALLHIHGSCSVPVTFGLGGTSNKTAWKRRSTPWAHHESIRIAHYLSLWKSRGSFCNLKPKPGATIVKRFVPSEYAAQSISTFD